MSRTFKITNPPMRGSDIEAWKKWLQGQAAFWGAYVDLPDNDVYDVETRSLTASICHGFGLPSASSAMEHGVTPELRIKLRNKRQTPDDKRRYADRADWRRRFARANPKPSKRVHTPIAHIRQDSWGWARGHDGIDLICDPKVPVLAICKAKVMRADSGGWWGKGAPSPSIAAKGDGIVIIRSLVNIGPIREGMNICYGHAESPQVRVNEIVEPGEMLARAGLANAWHIHWMVNRRSDTKGVGDMNPREILNYVRQHD